MKKFWMVVLALVIIAAVAVVFFPEQISSLVNPAPAKPVTLADAKSVGLELVYEGNKPAGVGSVQSFAIAGDYFVIAGRPSGSAENGGETKNQLIVISRSTKTDMTQRLGLDTKTYELGHANGMTYNPKTNELVVVGKRNESGKYEIAVRINLSNFSIVGTDRMACYGTGVAYNNAKGTYVVRSGKTIYTLNGIPGMVKNEVTTATDFTAQDMAFYNGYTYLANWISDGKDTAALRYTLDTNQNVVYKVDARGNIVDIFLFKEPHQELESIDFVNGEAYVLFNGVGKNDSGKFYIYRLKLSPSDL